MFLISFKKASFPAASVPNRPTVLLLELDVLELYTIVINL